jgi:soluble lytic murein transglycosylase
VLGYLLVWRWAALFVVLFGLAGLVVLAPLLLEQLPSGRGDQGAESLANARHPAGQAGADASAEASADDAQHDRGKGLQVDLPPLPGEAEAAELTARLQVAAADEVRHLLKRHPGVPAVERLRDQWLRRLVRERRWSDYLDAHADNGSIERNCWYRRALLGSDRAPEAFAGLEAVYLTGRSLPSDCDPLFATWSKVGGLRSELVWRRIARALHAGNPGVAAYQGRYLPAEQTPWLDLMMAVHRRPGLLLEQPITAERVPDEPRRQQILVYGLERLAGESAGSAESADSVEQLRASIEAAETLTPLLAERADAAVGRALALAGEPRGLEYLDRLDPRDDNQDLQRQRLRVALRLRAWPQLAAWSEQLSPAADELGKWRYWRGRALMLIATDADQRAAAMHAFAAAAGERTLWGFLAAELIGRPPALAHQPAPVKRRALKTFLRSAAVRRLQTLKSLGRDDVVRRDWLELVRLLPRQQQLVAARAAAELGWANESILALAEADHWDDLELRFPLAYADLLQAAAAKEGLPADWLYAVIRQESAFDADIASHAGAVGLMQLMPPTAREVAMKQGLAEPQRPDLIDPALNIRLGSAYLAQMQRRFDGHPLLASAAYNAGPTAVSRWLPEQPMAGELWLTEIPYAETRQYARRVLTYRIFYRHRLGLPPLRVGALLRRVD